MQETSIPSNTFTTAQNIQPYKGFNTDASISSCVTMSILVNFFVPHLKLWEEIFWPNSIIMNT